MSRRADPLLTAPGRGTPALQANILIVVFAVVAAFVLFGLGKEPDEIIPRPQQACLQADACEP